MSNKSAPEGFEPPSGRKIVIGSLAALIVAGIVLVAVILPAEYGIDPTGIGRLLGIEGMSAGQTQTIAIEDPFAGNENLREIEIPDFGEPVPLPNTAIAQHEASAPTTRTLTVELAPEGRTEIKAVMQKDKVLVFGWETDGGRIYQDFHGHNPEYGDDFWVRYKEDQRGSPTGYGSLVAPFDGEHGWYWVNLEEQPVTVSLTVTGYFEDMIDYSELF